MPVKISTGYSVQVTITIFFTANFKVRGKAFGVAETYLILTVILIAIVVLFACLMVCCCCKFCCHPDQEPFSGIDMPTKKKSSPDMKKDRNEVDEYERQRRQILDGILDGKTQNQSASSTSQLISSKPAQYDPPQPQHSPTSYSSHELSTSPSVTYSPPLSGGSFRDVPPSYEEVSTSAKCKKYMQLSYCWAYVPPLSDSPTQEPNVGGAVRVEDFASIEAALENLREDLNND